MVVPWQAPLPVQVAAQAKPLGQVKVVD